MPNFHHDLHKFYSTSKPVGLLWSNLSDQLAFSVPITFNKVISKRTILSDISQVFDPLGLVQPFTMKAKFLTQQSWLDNADWDDLPSLALA